MSSLPKAVYPFGSEKGEPIPSSVLGVKAGVVVTLAPGESRVVEFLPENKAVSFPNVVQLWSTGMAMVAVADPVKFGKFIVRDFNFDDKPALPADFKPVVGNPGDYTYYVPWISTTDKPIQGATSYTNPYIAPAGFEAYASAVYLIPDAYWNAGNPQGKRWRCRFDWSFTPGVIPEDIYCQLYAYLAGVSEPPLLHESPWDSGPKVAASGSYDGPLWLPKDIPSMETPSPEYGAQSTMRALGEDPPGMPFGGSYRIDNVVLYMVGDGPNPNRTNLHYLIPNNIQLLQVGEEITISNPAEVGGESITVICNQVTRWSQVVNPGTYGAAL